MATFSRTSASLFVSQRLRIRTIDSCRVNLRGLFGIATGPLSRTLEMEVSGPLDNIRVRPIGLKAILNVPATLVPDTAKGTSGVIRNGVALPLRVFDLFKSDSLEKKP